MNPDTWPRAIAAATHMTFAAVMAATSVLVTVADAVYETICTHPRSDPS